MKQNGFFLENKLDAVGRMVIPKQIRFYDLRHSCASLLLAQGAPMKIIQD